jgi:predicted MFS family arabinose efflux permease
MSLPPLAADHPRASAASRRTRRQLSILTVAAGLGAANLYYAQPLAAMMAGSLGVSQRAIGLVLMASQLGYALGMILLVPLGDARERRSLMVATAAAAGLALFLVAASPGYGALAATSLVLGFASSLPQMAVPFAVGLVEPAERGRAIGNVMGGLLMGILLSRTASGMLAGAIGWRLTFVCAALAMLALSLVLRFALPRQRPAEPISWRRVLASLGQVLRAEPLLRRHALIGACGFASFSAFWSTLSFHLARAGYGSRAAGLFGVVGIVGVVVAPLAGRLAGRVRPTLINAAGLGAVALSFVTFYVAGSALLGLGLGVVLLDAGVQASHLANQTVIFGLRPALRNRVNALYMVIYFAGGALGTAAAAFAWQRGGWAGVCATGGTLALLGLLPIAGRRRERAGGGLDRPSAR